MPDRVHWSIFPEEFVRLHAHAHERGALGQFLQRARPYVGARGAQAAEDVLHGFVHRAAIRHQHFLALGGAVVRHAAHVFFHRGARTHAIEALEPPAVLLDHFARALVVTGEHAAQHHEVRAGAEGLGDVARRSTPAVGTNAPAETVRGVGAFDHGGQLRVAHTGHGARGADRARADTDLDDVDA